MKEKIQEQSIFKRDDSELEPLEQVIKFLDECGKNDLIAKILETYSENSTNIEQYNMLAKLYLSIMDVENAERYVLKALSCAKTSEVEYNMRKNIVHAYNLLNYPEKALWYNNINLSMTPKDPECLFEKSFSLYLLNRKTEAKAVLDDIKTQEHELDEKLKDTLNFNYGTYDMYDGKFLKGLAGFLLNVKKLEIWFSPRELPYQFWNGGAYPGKTLILFMEGGGIGDEFITVRFMDNLKAMGFNPVFYTVRPDIAKVFNNCGYPAVTSIDDMPKDSMWTYAMQVPIWLKMDSPDVMRKDSYLYPSKERIDKFSFMKESKKFKIGVRWQGNTRNERSLHRQVYLKDIMKMLNEVYKDKDVEFYSLQVGDGSEDVLAYPEILDITNKITSYDDTLAILQNLDLVVTSCTSVLHASAIIGTETLALIPISEYFPWISPAPERSSVWYGDNLKLFRQVTTRKWDEPIEEMKQYLLNNE